MEPSIPQIIACPRENYLNSISNLVLWSFGTETGDMSILFLYLHLDPAHSNFTICYKIISIINAPPVTIIPFDYVRI